MREIHHVQRIDSEVPLRALFASIDLNDVTETLKRVERKTDRQDDTKPFNGIVPVESCRKSGDILIEEVEVLKEEQHHANRDDAHQQVPTLLAMIICLLDPDSCEVVDDDRSEQDENIDRDECHVEETTGAQQQQPAKPMWQRKIRAGHDDKE